jgi:hypothetical protein
MAVNADAPEIDVTFLDYPAYDFSLAQYRFLSDGRSPS